MCDFAKGVTESFLMLEMAQEHVTVTCSKFKRYNGAHDSTNQTCTCGIPQLEPPQTQLSFMLGARFSAVMHQTGGASGNRARGRRTKKTPAESKYDSGA